MGIVNQQTSIAKTVGINKVVSLDVQKDVNTFVNLTGTLATAEASADAVGGFAGPIDDGFTLVDFVGDLSRGEIHSEWWDRALNFDFPGGVLPFNEPTGALQGLGQDVPGVFLVDGAGAGLGPVTRSFTVTFGDTLAIPLVNFISVGFPGDDPVADIAPLFDSIVEDSLFLTVDGESVPLDDLLDARAPSGPFPLTVAEGGFLDEGFGLMPGATFQSAVDGYLVLLEGLDPGAHTISFGGVADGPIPVDAMVTINIFVRQAQGALAETDSFAQATEAGASSFSESLAAVSFENDFFV